MPVRVADMERLGLGKLLEYVNMSKDELHAFMVENSLETLEKLAIFLSEDTEICEICGNNYAHMDNCGICDDCFDYLQAHKNWR